MEIRQEKLTEEEVELLLHRLGATGSDGAFDVNDLMRLAKEDLS